MSNEMAGLLTVVVFAVVGYLAWKVFIAALKGLGLAGKSIGENGPEFMSKVFQSIAAGVICGVIVTFVSDADFQFTGTASLGMAVGTFIKSTFGSA